VATATATTAAAAAGAAAGTASTHGGVSHDIFRQLSIAAANAAAASGDGDGAGVSPYDLATLMSKGVIAAETAASCRTLRAAIATYATTATTTTTAAAGSDTGALPPAAAAVFAAADRARAGYLTAGDVDRLLEAVQGRACSEVGDATPLSRWPSPSLTI